MSDCRSFLVAPADIYIEVKIGPKTIGKEIVNTTPITKDEVLLFFMEHLLREPKTARFHIMLGQLFVDIETAIVVDQKTGSELLQVDSRTFRRNKKNALESGYWIDTPGHGNTPSTYTASAELVSLLLANRDKRNS